MLQSKAFTFSSHMSSCPAPETHIWVCVYILCLGVSRSDVGHRCQTAYFEVLILTCSTDFQLILMCSVRSLIHVLFLFPVSVFVCPGAKC